MSAAVEAYLVVDPVQDYEESLSIWGVFGSLRAAKYATRNLRHRNLDTYDGHRITEIQHWRGGTQVTTWEYRPLENAWTCTQQPTTTKEQP